MAFKEKHNKVGGRKVGQPNKLTKVNRAFLNDLLCNEGLNISTALNEVFKNDKKAYLSIVLKLVEFTIPRLTPIEAEENEEQRPTHVFKLKGNDKITFNGN